MQKQQTANFNPFHVRTEGSAGTLILLALFIAI